MDIIQKLIARCQGDEESLRFLNDILNEPLNESEKEFLDKYKSELGELEEMEKSITVRVTSSYGRKLIYPECDTAQLFAQLTRKQTLDNKDIEIIKNLGYGIKVQPPKL